MSEPYWGGTLDTSCEDKEGAWAALEGFLALHELTDETRYLTWAQHAADVVDCLLDHSALSQRGGPIHGTRR